MGRHIRPNERFKIIVAREDGEARFMSGYKKEYINMNCSSHRGPLGLLIGEPNQDDLKIAAQILARYGQGRKEEQVDVEIRMLNVGETQNLTIKPLLADEIPQEWFI